MPYDEAVADRVRKLISRRKGVQERKMFGGIAFLLNGNMCCGVLENRLVLRLGNEKAAAALSEPHTREMDFTGKPLKSMVYVEPPGFRSDDALRAWLSRAIDFARSLPPK